MQPRLRDLAAQVSEVLYLTGISKSVSDAAVVRLLCDVQSAQEGALPPVEVDCSLRRHPTVGGRVLFVGTNPVRRELVGLDVVRGCQPHTDQGQDLLGGM